MNDKLKYCQTCLSSDRNLFPINKFQSTLYGVQLWEVISLNGGICWECKAVIIKFLQFKSRVRHVQNVLSGTEKLEDIKSLSTLIHNNNTTEIQYNYDLETNDPEIKEEINNSDDDNSSDDKTDIPTLDIYVESITNINDCKRYQKEKKDKHKIKKKNDLTSCDEKTNEISNLDVYVESITNEKDYKRYQKEKKDKHKVKNINCEENTADIPTLDIYVESITNIKDSKRYPKEKKDKNRVKKRNDEFKDKSGDEIELKEKFTMIVLSEEEMLKNRDEKRNQPNFKKIPFKCDMCVLGFTRKDTYDVHMMKKHDESIGKYACNVCLIRFTNKKSVDRHKNKHFVSFKCRLCTYETLEEWSALNHVKIKHSDDTQGRIHCNQCEVIATTPEELSEHIRTEHTLYCSECGEKFKGKNTLRTHKIRIHAVKREFICDVCTKTFMTKTRLESHMVTHDTLLAKKLSFCYVCQVQYKNIYVYRNHLKNSANHSERAYQCRDCNKKFASKVYWQKHYKFYHLHKSQFKCEMCNKLFISDWRLKNHRQTQHGTSRGRNYSCNVCGKKFFTLSTLKGHELIHSEERSYMCEQCGDTFKQRPALYTHVRLLHTKELQE